jgi:hypothetical protein
VWAGFGNSAYAKDQASLLLDGLLVEYPTPIGAVNLTLHGKGFNVPCVRQAKKEVMVSFP